MRDADADAAAAAGVGAAGGGAEACVEAALDAVALCLSPACAVLVEDYLAGQVVVRVCVWGGGTFSVGCWPSWLGKAAESPCAA